MPGLVFIDTNIFLNFYRLPGGEALTRQLSYIDQHKSHIITSNQVEMEFKKNRQSALLLLRKQFNEVPKLKALPPILENAQAGLALKTAHEKHRQQHKKVQKRIVKLLGSPGSDPVYIGLNKLFKHDSPLNLKKDHKDRYEIRRLARKRWHLGYPPRKKNDTSIGDAIHWEWIVRCAQENPGKDIVIVSRDHDFGEEFEGNSYLNDWLVQEFKERAGKKGRKILLTERLTHAFKQLGLKVSEKSVKEEKELLDQDKERFKAFIETKSSAASEGLYGRPGTPFLSSSLSFPSTGFSLPRGFLDDEDS